MSPELSRLLILKKMVEETISLQVLLEKDKIDDLHKKRYMAAQREELRMVGYMVEYGFDIRFPDQTKSEVEALESHLAIMQERGVNADKHLFDIIL